MSHIKRFVVAPGLEAPDLAILARHLAMELLPAAEVCGHLAITETELERVRAEPDFVDLYQRERRRLLTPEGQRDLNDWKQLLVEAQYWDRLMGMAANPQTSAPVIVDAMKVVKRPAPREAGGGAGSTGHTVVINMGGETTRVTTTVVSPPVIEGEVG